jgi:hypothetical protein
MANSYSLGSPNVCTRSPIERGDLVTRQFSDHLRWHISSTHQRYFGDVITRHQIRILRNTSPAHRNRRPRGSCWPPLSIPDFLFRVWPVGPCRSHSRGRVGTLRNKGGMVSCRGRVLANGKACRYPPQSKLGFLSLRSQDGFAGILN